MIHGVDVSYAQPIAGLDYPQLVKAGVQFAWCKCTDAHDDGTFFTDDSHDTHSICFRAAGAVTGSYCFGHTSWDPLRTADYFTQHAFFDQLRPVIDMETLRDKHIPGNAGPWALAWLQRIEQNTRTKPIVYSSTSYLATMVQQAPGLYGYDVWAAAYRVPPSPDHPPKLPGSYLQQRLVAYQWTGSGRLPGCSVAIDRDVLVGPDLSALLV